MLNEGLYARFSQSLIWSLTNFRGSTPLDLQPRVNGKQINLRKLLDIVVERGGYDSVSAEKLAWRKVGQEFGLGSSNAAAYAFALKTVYYKNLALVRRFYLPLACTHAPAVPTR